MKALLTTLMLLGPLSALAVDNAPAGPRREEMRERAEKRMRTMRMVGMAEALELNDADVLRLRGVMEKFDERRAPLRQEVADAAKTIKAAAAGDAAAMNQVDAAVNRAFDARAKLAALDREMYGELAKGLPADKRAKLAIFLAEFRGRARDLMEKAKGKRMRMR